MAIERPDTPLLSNPRSERIRGLRALSGRSFRSRSGRFLLEGPQVVREAARAGRASEILATDMAFERYPEIFSAAREHDIRVQLATPEVIAAASDSAQGILGTAPLSTVTLETAVPIRARLVAVLFENQDPGNAGTIIRTADAAGADAVIMTRGSVDVYNPKVVRATAGSIFHLPVVTGVELAPTLELLRERGFAILAADGAGAHDLDQLQDRIPDPQKRLDGGRAREDEHDSGPDLTRSTAWLFGNEARGLASAELDSSVTGVRVPIHGGAESLNLAIATALCLYASARAQRRRDAR